MVTTWKGWKALALPRQGMDRGAFLYKGIPGNWGVITNNKTNFLSIWTHDTQQFRCVKWY